MLRGVGRNGEHLYPSFPYTSYQRMALDDVRDLFAFLKTLPGRCDAVGAARAVFPLQRAPGLGLWKLLYLDGKTFAPDPAKSAELNRGAYLVEGPGHCAECHSPRDAFGGIIADRRFAGGAGRRGQGLGAQHHAARRRHRANGPRRTSPICSSPGFNPDGDSVGSTMADVVLNTAKLSAADRAAMAAYLKSLPPRPGKAPPKK